MKNRKWLTIALCTAAMMSVVACSDDSGSSNEPTKEPSGYTTAKMTIDPASKTLAGGETQKMKVTYLGDNEPISDVKIRFESSNTDCVVVDSDQVIGYTNDSGEVSATVKAKKVSSACTAKISAKDVDGPASTVTAQIKVSATAGGNDDEDPDTPVTGNAQVIITNPSTKNVEIADGSSNVNVTVVYKDASGNLLSNTTIKSDGGLDKDKNECATTNSKKVTNETGAAEFTIKPVGNNCATTFTFFNGSASDTLKVQVGEPTEFFVDLDFYYIAPGGSKSDVGVRSKDVKNVFYGTPKSKECPSKEAFETDKAGVDGYTDFGYGVIDGERFKTSNPVFTQKVAVDKEDGTDGNHMLVAAYAVDDKDNIIGYGCSQKFDIDSKDGKVDVLIYEQPINLYEEYDVVSNFDLTSGFQKTAHKEMPKAEEMSAGDWIQFIVNLFKDPVAVLVDFVWVNSIQRLSDIDDMPEWITKTFLNGGTKTIAVAALTGLLDGLLKDKETGNNYSWYDIILSTGTDVADLASNMQLKGTFKVNSFQNMSVSADSEFDELQYKWTNKYVSVSCDAKDYYNNDPADPECRHRMVLSNGSVAGSWNGTVKASADGEADGYLDIKAHPLTFKWATILFTAVFGNGGILPTILDYSVSGAYKDLMIKAFMSNVLFKPIANYYTENKACTLAKAGEVEGDAGVYYPPLSIRESNNGLDQSCERFIEAILYLIYPSAVTVTKSGSTCSVSDGGWISSVLGAASKLACGEDGIGQLDTLVLDSLNKVQVSTDNAMMLSSKDCAMMADGTKYDKIGEPDASFATANNVFDNSINAPTTRCKWNLDFSMGENPVTIKGLFHSTNHSEK